MGNVQALRSLREEFHLSFSQLAGWRGCSLQYMFRFVAGLPPESTPVALLFGSAIHQTLECALQEWKHSGTWASADDLTDIFEADLRRRLTTAEAPFLYKRDLPSEEWAINMGRRLLEVFRADAPRHFAGLTLLETELPLGVPLLTEGAPTGLTLIAVLDAVLQNERGDRVVIDFKTASRAYTDEQVQADDQLSCYALVLQRSGWVSAATPVICQLHVLQKLKEPRLDVHVTLRNAAKCARFEKTAVAVAKAIENRVFVPSPSYRCPSCEYQGACKRW